METNHSVDDQPYINLTQIERAAPIEAVELLLRIRLGYSWGVPEGIEILEEKAQSFLDPVGGITKEAYTLASKELVSLAREDRSKHIDDGLAQGGLLEYVLRQLPPSTTWRELHAWLETLNLHPIRVIIPKNADDGFGIFPVQRASLIETTFNETTEVRYKGVQITVQKKVPKRNY